ncbi:MAG: gliding motility-associated C-terminal domain-containing protein [Flavobacteriaceae bacterium]
MAVLKLLTLMELFTFYTPKKRKKDFFGTFFFIALFTLTTTCLKANWLISANYIDAIALTNNFNNVNDSDNDGIIDSVEDKNLDGDNDPTTDPTDTDGDTIPNYLDIDSDNDGILDNYEAQRLANYIAPSGIDANGNGLDDAYEFSTGFGLTPIDTDRGGIPDYLDIDSDIDGIRDNIEGQPYVGYVPPSGIDANGNGLDDAYEGTFGFGINPINTDGDLYPDFRDFDSDGDGIKDKIEAQTSEGYIPPTGDANDNDIDDSYENGLNPIDTDGDNVPDYRDLDTDNDGILDGREAQPVDAYIPPSGFDGNTDGLDNAYGNDGLVPVNSDTDTKPDFRDLDSDNDGCSDALEGSALFDNSAIDTNGALIGGEAANGIPLVANDGQLNVSATDSAVQAAACNVDCLSVPTNDCDGDGVTNEQEVTDGTDPQDPCSFILANQTVTTSNEWDAADCDGDGVPNGQEVIDGTDPLDPCDYNPANITLAQGGDFLVADCDGDGVTNEQEVTDGTDPQDPCSFILANQTVTTSNEWDAADCDGDGVPNGQEVIDGTDPLDPCDLLLASQTLTPSAEWLAQDCDNDGNPNGTDPNPLVATANDDAASTEPLTAVTVNILDNDDYLSNNDPNNLGTTSITQIDGTAQGTVAIDAETGELVYTPTADENDTEVTIVYEVCNTDPEPDVCATATVTISVGAPMADQIDAVDDTFNASGQEATDGGPLSGNVFDNDTLNNAPIDPNDVILTSTPTGPLSINPDGTIELAPNTDAGTYTIEYTICEVATPDNCDTATVTIVVGELVTDAQIIVMQMVTPNNDGRNDFLWIENVDKALDNTLRIFNRWGIAVYEGTDYNNQNNVFDGRSKGRSTVSVDEYLPAGVYYYIFEYNTTTKGNVTDSGYIYISK